MSICFKKILFNVELGRMIKNNIRNLFIYFYIRKLQFYIIIKLCYIENDRILSKYVGGL